MERTVGPYTNANAWEPSRPLTPEELDERIKADKEILEARERDQTPQWLRITDKLAGGDRQKWDYFFNMSVIEGLNAYSFYKLKHQERAEAMDQAAAKGIDDVVYTALRQLLLYK